MFLASLRSAAGSRLRRARGLSAEEAVVERDVESGHCAVIRAGIRAEREAESNRVGKDCVVLGGFFFFFGWLGCCFFGCLFFFFFWLLFCRAFPFG